MSKVIRIKHIFGNERYVRNARIDDGIIGCNFFESYEGYSRPIGSVNGYEDWQEQKMEQKYYNMETEEWEHVEVPFFPELWRKIKMLNGQDKAKVNVMKWALILIVLAYLIYKVYRIIN